MKKLLMALGLLLGASSLFAAQGGSAGAATDPSNRAEYRWVLNNDAVAHSVGDVVVYKDASPYGVVVETTTSANVKTVAGVVAINSLPASGYGWIQIYGYHSAINVKTTTTAGDCLGTYTTAGSMGTTSTAGACFATAFTTTGTSTTVRGMIHAM